MHRFSSTFGTLALVACASACANDFNDLFQNATGGAGGTVASTSSGKNATTAVSSTGTKTGATTAVTTSPSATTGPGETVATSGPGVTTAVSTVATTGPGTPLPQVTCNNGLCQPGQVCCFNPNGPGDHCGTAGQCNGGYVELSCNGPEDCPNQVCCAKLKNQSTLDGISCENSCTDADQVVVCSEAAPNVCPMGTQCQQVNQLGAGYFLCF